MSKIQKLKSSFFLLILFAFNSEFGYSQELFHSNDRVCFVGNSITNNGEFHHNILLYHLTRFPSEKVSFYNCGIPGDRAEEIVARLDTDVMVHNPSHIVIMTGMNDVDRTLYPFTPTINVDTLKMRKNAIELYKKNLELIVKQFLGLKINVTLQKPSIYDQTAKLALPANFGVNDALQTCANFIKELAQKYKLQTIDYWTFMNDLNLEKQKVNPAFTLTSKDRVHPQATGHFVMFYKFLKDKNAAKYVSKIAISKNKRKNSQTINCNIQSIEKTPFGLKFNVLEKSLPFPTVTNQQEALQLVPFTTEFNQQILQIDGLKKDKYQLSIDEIKIGIFSSAQLKTGVNLSEIQTTPQYLQAVKVRNILVELWNYESKLRSIKFIEYNPYFKSVNKNDRLEKQKQVLDSIFTVKYASNLNYYLLKSKDYFNNKALENEFKIKSDSLRKAAFEAAQPVVHTFKLITTK